MITVAILINGQPIMARSAVNKGDADVLGRVKYRVDDGSYVLHNPNHRAVDLAVKMLDTIKEKESFYPSKNTDACFAKKESLKMWDFLSWNPQLTEKDYFEKHKIAFPERLSFLCEYMKNKKITCDKCPIDWGEADSHSSGKKRCLGKNSIYLKWSDLSEAFIFGSVEDKAKARVKLMVMANDIYKLFAKWDIPKGVCFE